jgi:ABC-type methionine transport system ATPase subunit
MKRLLRLTYPEELVTEPVIWKVATSHRLVPNIRSAKVTATAGMVVVEFSGEPADLEAGLRALTGLGIRAEELER